MRGRERALVGHQPVLSPLPAGRRGGGALCRASRAWYPTRAATRARAGLIEQLSVASRAVSPGRTVRASSGGQRQPDGVRGRNVAWPGGGRRAIKGRRWGRARRRRTSEGRRAGGRAEMHVPLQEGKCSCRSAPPPASGAGGRRHLSRRRPFSPRALPPTYLLPFPPRPLHVCPAHPSVLAPAALPPPAASGPPARGRPSPSLQHPAAAGTDASSARRSARRRGCSSIIDGRLAGSRLR